MSGTFCGLVDDPSPSGRRRPRALGDEAAAASPPQRSGRTDLSRSNVIPFFVLPATKKEDAETCVATVPTTPSSTLTTASSPTKKNSKSKGAAEMSSSTSKRKVRKNRISHSSIADPYENLLESNPYDDLEPDPPEKYPFATPDSLLPAVKSLQTGESLKANPFNIPIDPDEEWDWYYQLFVSYKNQNANSNPVMESLLRNWMASQRKSYMKTLGILDISSKTNWGTRYLTQRQKKSLDEVGFDWGHLCCLDADTDQDVVFSEGFQRRVREGYLDWKWNPMYERLARFKGREGHTHVPSGSSLKGLGAWCKEQRAIRWEMPQRRRERLDDLKFDWSWNEAVTEPNIELVRTTPKINEAEGGTLVSKQTKEEERTTKKTMAWSTRLRQLKEYRKRNGHCDVPVDYDGGLGRWVERTKRRRKELSPRTVMQLERLGFEFSND